MSDVVTTEITEVRRDVSCPSTVGRYCVYIQAHPGTPDTHKHPTPMARRVPRVESHGQVHPEVLEEPEELQLQGSWTSSTTPSVSCTVVGTEDTRTVVGSSPKGPRGGGGDTLALLRGTGIPLYS